MHLASIVYFLERLLEWKLKLHEVKQAEIFDKFVLCILYSIQVWLCIFFFLFHFYLLIPIDYTLMKSTRSLII